MKNQSSKSSLEDSIKCCYQKSRVLLQQYADYYADLVQRQYDGCRAFNAITTIVFVMCLILLLGSGWPVDQIMMQGLACVLMGIVVTAGGIFQIYIRRCLDEALAFARIAEKEDPAERQLALEEFAQKYPRGKITRVLVLGA